MTRQALDAIIDECLTHLKAGKPASFCLEKFKSSRTLREVMPILEAGVSIPKKPVTLDQEKIWNKISTEIKNSQSLKEANTQHPFFIFRATFSRSVLAVITLLVFVGLVNTTAVAAKNSIPGETLYPVKKTVEKLQLTLTFGEENKTEVRIQQAETRLTEAQTLVEKGSQAGSDEMLDEDESLAVEKTINEMVSTTKQIIDGNETKTNKEILEKIALLADKQEAVLVQIESKLSGEPKENLNAALDSTLNTKQVVKNNLAELENKEVQGSASASSTPQTVSPTSTPTSATTTEGGITTEGESATTTEDVLEALGDADATSTTEITPLVQDPPSNSSSTYEIIEFE